MRALDLEARVIAAVDRIKTGKPAESDLIECKRDWPKEEKARQLAGSLNRAGGEPVIYIVGIDEKTGCVHPVGDIDVLDWWNQVKTRFDQLPPEMVRHISVPVGDDGEHVVAVAFASDRAPYVVKTGSANPSLEIPIREGTGTRTARRDELLRLMIPTVGTPGALVLAATLTSYHHFPQAADLDYAVPESKERISISGYVQVYFEHPGPSLLTLPNHGMGGLVHFAGQAFPATARHMHYKEGKRLPDWEYGVSLNGPNGVKFGVNISHLDVSMLKVLGAMDNLQLRLEFEVLHARRPLALEVELARNAELSNLPGPGDKQVIAAWSFGRTERRVNVVPPPIFG